MKWGTYFEVPVRPRKTTTLGNQLGTSPHPAKFSLQGGDMFLTYIDESVL